MPVSVLWECRTLASTLPNNATGRLTATHRTAAGTAVGKHLKRPSTAATHRVSGSCDKGAGGHVAWPVPEPAKRTLAHVTVAGWVLNPALAPAAHEKQPPEDVLPVALYAAVWYGSVLYMFESPRDCTAFFEVRILRRCRLVLKLLPL